MLTVFGDSKSGWFRPRSVRSALTEGGGEVEGHVIFFTASMLSLLPRSQFLSIIFPINIRLSSLKSHSLKRTQTIPESFIKELKAINYIPFINIILLQINNITRLACQDDSLATLSERQGLHGQGQRHIL